MPDREQQEPAAAPETPTASAAAAQAAENNDHQHGRTKFATDCSAEHAASLECISNNYGNQHEVCQSYFDAYKRCRAMENERRRAERAAASGAGGGGSSSWFGGFFGG